MAKRGQPIKQTPALKLADKLVLNQWILSLFGAPDLKNLASGLKSPDYEGFDEKNVNHIYHALAARKSRFNGLTAEMLLTYDENISRFWRQIVERRNRKGNHLKLKYFQYLSLLFTEIYLDRYFSNPDNLLDDLNRQVAIYNSATARSAKDKLGAYEKADLNKLAFWMATGSGKTLLMHVNILQYLHYMEKHGKPADLNRIILLTPNEGLSHQHFAEFVESDIEAELFSKERGWRFGKRPVEIIDINKLRDESGDKTVAVEAFEGNNLVLVDEGHRGTSGSESGQWLTKRNQLCENGFSFEYSATFGQAMRASGSSVLEAQYARCILFDYSYRYFYEDGYGKDYKILNLPDDEDRQEDEELRRRYLTACLLSFYQQQKLYDHKQRSFREYLIERPLWIFVGGSVTKTTSKRDLSDVLDILLFLADFVGDERRSAEIIDMLLRGQSGMHNASGQDIFGGHAFSPLVSLGMNSEMVFRDALKTLFNAPAIAALHIENLKGSEGEVALRLGDNDPFGVINIGDPAGLCKICGEREELVVADRDFSGSLFRVLNETESRINILIGSRKFTEGWSSWRVSTMGLMNIGKNEGSQIIQLFGRGVRLKGKDFCLKRSRRIEAVNAPQDIERLETLNIFGVHADYMRQFKEYLEEEGLQNIDDRIEFILPVIRNLGDVKLKVIKPQKGTNFKCKGPKPTINLPDERLKRRPVTLDWYPKLQTLSSRERTRDEEAAEKDLAHFQREHIAFMDMDAIFFEIEQFKNERAWFNLNLSREKIRELLSDKSWYQLFIPKDEMNFNAFDRVRQWQEIAVVLLKRYCERFYLTKNAEYESKFLEYQELKPDDTNFISEYRILIDQSRQDIAAKLNEIKRIIENGALKETDFSRLEINQSGFRALSFSGHLYQPMLYANSDLIEVKPAPLNEGERDFVIDLRAYCQNNKPFFMDKELYLLRNRSRGKGIGFFQANNFYPDFILWLLVNGRQYINFIDPKGLRNIEGFDDPKVNFYRSIKELERDLGNKNIVLHSFIVSNTPMREIAWWTPNREKTWFSKNHILFQYEDQGEYINAILNMALNER